MYTALHNFISESAIADEDFDRCDQDENYMPMPNEYSSEPGGGHPHGGGENHNMNTFRDSITARREWWKSKVSTGSCLQNIKLNSLKYIFLEFFKSLLKKN
jgi:hypothetical protein